jgi:ketosteroid isomerase-like protein
LAKANRNAKGFGTVGDRGPLRVEEPRGEKMTKSDVAWSYFDLCGQGRIDEALALLDDSGTFWDVLTRDSVPMPRHKDAVRPALGIVPLRFELLSTIEAGDQVVLEVESHASLPDGDTYNNLYCFLITVRDGKILHVREYNDTHHVLNLPRSMRALFAKRT